MQKGSGYPEPVFGRDDEVIDVRSWLGHSFGQGSGNTDTAYKWEMGYDPGRAAGSGHLLFGQFLTFFSALNPVRIIPREIITADLVKFSLPAKQGQGLAKNLPGVGAGSKIP